MKYISIAALALLMSPISAQCSEADNQRQENALRAAGVGASTAIATVSGGIAGAAVGLIMTRGQSNRAMILGGVIGATAAGGAAYDYTKDELLTEEMLRAAAGEEE